MRALATVLGVAPLFALAACMSMPFYVAAVAGDTPALQGHLSAGTPVDKPNTGGYTALTYAASNGHPGAVRFLLERGANPDHRDDGGRTPLDHALASPSPNAEVLSLLRAARTGGAPLSPAPAKKYVGVEGLEALAAQMAAQRAAEAPQRPAPGNLDDAGYDRMRAAAGMPAEQRLVSDVDSPKTRAAERPDDFALVVGIEQYSRLPAAKFAERDADAVKKHLLALGYPERNIITLKGGQATRGAMQGYVEEWLPRNVKPASRVFVYFSGHGSPDTKTGDAYLVPWDGDAMFLKSTAYPLKSLYASLAKLKAKRVLVALDSCFSGAGGRSVLADGARPLVARVEDVSAPTGLTVLSAASGDEITATIPDQGHGAFTYHLLKAIGAGKTSAKAAYAELKPRVQDEARRQNREQTPLLLGDDATF